MQAMASINHAGVDPNDIPYKLQPGKASFELVASLPAIAEYLCSLPSKGANKKSVTREEIVQGTSSLLFPLHANPLVSSRLKYI